MARKNPVQKIVRSVKDAQRRHRARHRPTGLGFALADSVRYLDPRVWDAVTASASVFLGRPYLEALEGAAPRTVRPRCALVFQGGEPVAAVAAQLVDITAARLAATRRGKGASSPDPVRRAISAAASGVRQKALERIGAHILVCGNVLTWGQYGVAFAPGAAPAEVWPGVAEALYRIRRAERLAGQTDLILVKDIATSPPARSDGAEALRTFSYRPIPTDPDRVLALPPAWRRYEDYLASLSSRYRKSTQGIASDFEAAGLRLEPLEGLATARERDRLHALYLEVHNAAAVRMATLEPEYLPSLARAFGPAFRVTVARRGEAILGFVTTLLDGETAVGYTIGFDRAANAEAPIYFRLLQAVVADAIALGARRLSLGRTALEPKARLGAKPVPLQVWVRHRVPFLNWILRGLLGAVPHHEAPERDPFKR